MEDDPAGRESRVFRNAAAERCLPAGECARSICAAQRNSGRTMLRSATCCEPRGRPCRTGRRRKLFCNIADLAANTSETTALLREIAKVPGLKASPNSEYRTTRLTLPIGSRIFNEIEGATPGGAAQPCCISPIAIIRGDNPGRIRNTPRRPNRVGPEGADRSGHENRCSRPAQGPTMLPLAILAARAKRARGIRIRTSQHEDGLP